MSHHYTFTITQAQLLTANQRLHWRQRAERTKHLRQRGAYAQQLDGGRLERATLVAQFTYPDRRRRDDANLAPTVKALIDGIVSGYSPGPSWRGLLPDDDANHLVAVTYRRAGIDPRLKTPRAVRVELVFEEVGE